MPNTNKTVCIQVPTNLHEVPIISNLVANYNLSVNIQGAILDQKATCAGWFELVLKGDSLQVEQAVSYLKDIGVEIWNEKLNI
jgi:ABC-type methionine transport system ATPase subunit